jgi:hypothetical protein
MKPPDVALRELVLQWLDKAGANLDAVEQLCAQEGRFRGIVAFHCQQAAERYLRCCGMPTCSQPSEWKFDTQATRRRFFKAARSKHLT